MALYYSSLIALIMVSMVMANQPESPQALRSFSDRQDKFNGNYNEAMDSYSGGNSKRVRGPAPAAPVADPADSYSNYRNQANIRPRQQPSTPSRQYDESTDYEAVNRNGDPLYYNEPSPSSYSSLLPSNNRKTFGSGKTNNLALVVSPLAGIAFVAAAAAVAISPVYMTMSSSLLGRKKRGISNIDPSIVEKVTPEMMRKIQELQTLEKFLASIPKETDYQQQIMSMYLSCSGYTRENNVCLDRIFCEYGNAESRISEEERDVLSIVLYNIMSNEFVPIEYKHRLRSAARIGRDFQQCNRYDCPALNEQTFSY